MIDLERLGGAAEKLRVYDVIQGGWEHDPDPYLVNASHILLHLSKGMTAKSFADPDTSANSIAPDHMQHALRLGRWIDCPVDDLIPTNEQKHVTEELAQSFGSMPMHQVAAIEASATLASNLHDLDHDSSQMKGEGSVPLTAMRASRFLLYSVELQAEEHDFDMFEAFDARLANLRERFDIPEPEAV